MNKIKYMQIQQNNIYSDQYPLAIDAINVSLVNGKDLQTTIGSINVDTDGDITTNIQNLQLNKQNILTFDETPTAGSYNPVYSQGIYSALNDLENRIAGISQNVPSDWSAVSGPAVILNKPTTFAELGISSVPGSAISGAVAQAQIANSVDWADVTNHPNTLSDFGINTIPASLLTGIINLNNLPTQIIQKPISVASDAARFALSASDVNLYDAVIVQSTQRMYYIIDTSQLGNENGYLPCPVPTLETATFSWNNITDKPTTLAGYGLEGDVASKTDLEAKQDALTFDSKPIAESDNPVTSHGIYSALVKKQNTLIFDDAPKENSDNPVKSRGIFNALSTKQNTLSYDPHPQERSQNSLTSGVIYNALLQKQDLLTFDDTPTQNSNNPVTSQGIKTYIDEYGGDSLKHILINNIEIESIATKSYDKGDLIIAGSALYKATTHIEENDILSESNCSTTTIENQLTPIVMTLQEYRTLTNEELMDGKVRYVYDTDDLYTIGEEVPF